MTTFKVFFMIIYEDCSCVFARLCWEEEMINQKTDTQG